MSGARGRRQALLGRKERGWKVPRSFKTPRGVFRSHTDDGPGSPTRETVMHAPMAQPTRKVTADENEILIVKKKTVCH